MNKITVHQGLAELKLLDARIKKANQQATFVKVNKVTNEKINGMSKEDFQDKIIKATSNSVEDLITRRNAIKKTVIKSNAVTTGDFNGTEMTVAEAIERKSSIDYDKMVLNNMINQYNQAHAEVNKHNESLIQQADNYVTGLFENKEKVDEETIKKLTEDFINARKKEVLDPLGLLELIEKKTKEIEDFETAVDYKLSELNATTFIEV